MKKGCAATCVFHGLIIGCLLGLVILMASLENANVLGAIIRHP